MRGEILLALDSHTYRYPRLPLPFLKCQSTSEAFSTVFRWKRHLSDDHLLAGTDISGLSGIGPNARMIDDPSQSSG